MASIVPALMGRDPEAELKPVVDYAVKRGVTGLLSFIMYNIECAAQHFGHVLKRGFTGLLSFIIIINM